MQQYAANEERNFNTPEFVALLERTLDVGKRLDDAEPSKSTQKAALQLFENYSGGERYNAGRDYGLSHTIPFRVINEQPNLLRGKALVYVVDANSPWLDEVIGYLEYELTDGSISSGNNADMLTGVQPRVRDSKSADSPSTVTAGYLADLDNYSGTVCFAPMRTIEMYESALVSFVGGNLSAGELAETISQPKNNPNQ